MIVVDVQYVSDVPRVVVTVDGRETGAGCVDGGVDGSCERGVGCGGVRDVVTSVLEGIESVGNRRNIPFGAVGNGDVWEQGDKCSFGRSRVVRSLGCGRAHSDGDAVGVGDVAAPGLNSVGVHCVCDERVNQVDDLSGADGSDESTAAGGTVCVASGRDCGLSDQCNVLKGGRVLGPNGGVSRGRGPNYEKNQLRRVARKNARKSVKVGESRNVSEVRSAVGSGSGQVLGGFLEKEQSSLVSELKKSFDERRIAENKLATQRAEYNIRRNNYLQKARVSEQKWETERLTSDEMLRKISEARLGASPGFAKTIVEEGLASSSAPSLSDGTVSPNSSISVEEVQKMNRTIEKQAAAVVELQKKLDKFVEMFGDEGETVDDIIYPEQRKRDSTPQEPTHKVMWGECVPLKGRYKFQADHYQNGNLVIAIDGEIVEVDWRGEPFEYCGRDVLYVTPSMDGHIDE